MTNTVLLVGNLGADPQSRPSEAFLIVPAALAAGAFSLPGEPQAPAM